MSGVQLQPGDSGPLQSALISSTYGTITAIAGVTGSVIKVYKLFLVVTGAVTITFEDGSTALSGAMALSANGAITLDLDGQPWFPCSVGNAFNIIQSATTQVSGTVYYTMTNYN